MGAMKAGMSRNAARKYLRQNDVTEQRRVPHVWGTRPDPLEAIWPQALEMLRQAPELEAKALLEHLRQAHRGAMAPGLLRTFQRRVRQWRLAEGPEKEVFFTQEHRPGRVLAVDWTDMGGLGITLCGQPFGHLLFHAVLPYSNWEWAVRARSESMLSLRGGLKATLGRLGKRPAQLLVDQSSAATHQLHRDGSRRGFNAEFVSVCAHYRIEPRTINVARPQENGDCESAHGHLKRRVSQHLLLRGGRDFETEEQYDLFLLGVIERANRLRLGRLEEELAAMGELPAGELPDYRELMVRVGRNSTIRVRNAVYSVPSRLIGTRLLARVYENRIALLEGRAEVARLPRAPGHRGPVIDFRHLIGHLLRKPGAFAGYRWREELFPSPVYRAAYDRMERDGAGADRRYLEVLKVAADHGVVAVENALEQLLCGREAPISAAGVRGLLDDRRDQERAWRDRPPMEIRLEDYDRLLHPQEEEVARAL